MRDTSLREILEVARAGFNLARGPEDNKRTVDEAIAAIEALLPEKQNLHRNESGTDYFYRYGWNAAIDQIHQNFKGGR